MLGFTAGVDPKVAIAISFALAFVIVVVADLAAGLVLFTFLAFLEIVPFGGPALSFTKLLGLLLLISWLAVMAAQRQVRLDAAVVRPLVYLVGGLLGWVLLSATWADDPGESLVVFSRYALNAMLFVIVLTSVQKRSTASWLVGAFVAGTTVAAIYAIATPGRFASEYGRIESAALDPNELAAVLVPASMLCLFVALGLRKAPVIRILAGAVGVLCGATILLTVSRGGLIALAVALVTAIVVGGRWRIPLALLAVTIASSVFIYFAGFASPQVVAHLEATTQGDARLNEGRVTIWGVAWRMAEDHPVRGVGAGNFSANSIAYVLQPGMAPRSDLIVNNPSVVHNTYLETMAELGLIGAGLYVALIGFCVGALFKAARTFARLGDLTMELLSRGLIAALVGVLVSDFFISDQFSKALWLLLALGPAMLLIARRQRAETVPPEIA